MLEIISNFLFERTPLLYLTQSLWRDEAFSVFISRHEIGEIIRLTAGDFNPPLYYLLLRGWMQVFGDSVIVLRMFSFFTFVLLIMVVHVFAKKVFKSRFVVWAATLLALTNPMLLYFAFEIRMYALLALFATSSMYFFHEKKWMPYILATAAGLYTQPFMLFVVLAQGAHALWAKKLKALIKPWVITGVLFLPWLPVLIKQFAASKFTWIHPITLRLVRSVTGNLYVGYEGTPRDLWNVLTVVSIFFIAIAAFLVRQKKNQSFTTLVTAWVFVPIVLVMTISVGKPIFVHRYLIFVTVGEIFLIATLIQHMIQKPFAKALGIFLFILFAAVNIYAAPYHQKTDYQTSFLEIARIAQPGDVVYAESALNYFESLYYAPEGIPAYLYNPNKKTPPLYVGGVGIPQSAWKTTLPYFPNKAFLINKDGSFDIVSVITSL